MQATRLSHTWRGTNTNETTQATWFSSWPLWTTSRRCWETRTRRRTSTAEKTAQALERIAYLLEGEESEGALMRIADTLEEMLTTLETALDVENEHSPAYELWRIRLAVEDLTGQSHAD